MVPDTQQRSAEPPGLSIATRNFGTITVRPEQVITFPHGLLGFADLHRYVLIEHNQESPFLWMQSLDNPELAFVVADPVTIVPAYRITPAPEVFQELAEEGIENLKIFVILTIPPGRPQDITANLMGPIVISLKNRQGKQLVIEDAAYSHKYRLLTEKD
jgi:flagellar assembly factor FliW